MTQEECYFYLDMERIFIRLHTIFELGGDGSFIAKQKLYMYQQLFKPVYSNGDVYIDFSGCICFN
jgi:hypothetical protein